ncbi:MAG: hypothetical protein KDC71_13015 [Acidobacteria bacterium]|nr:hypothetical protein [Acidobacteriota bacterium]
MVDPQLEITRLINAWQSGDKPSETAVFEAIYRQLHQMGRRFMAAESTDHTLSATGLVGELYLKLNNHGLSFANRHGFFALASRAMRHILVDYARHKKSQKREARLVPLRKIHRFFWAIAFGMISACWLWIGR